MSTGAAALTTTTVRSLTAATRRISSAWRPGKARVVRSRPSVSVSADVPTQTMATSAAAAAATARSSSASPSGVRKPTRKPARLVSLKAYSTTNIDGHALLEMDVGDEVLTGLPEEVVAAGRGAVGEPVQDDLVVDQEPGQTGLGQRELEDPRLLGNHGPG